MVVSASLCAIRKKAASSEWRRADSSAGLPVCSCWKSTRERSWQQQNVFLTIENSREPREPRLVLLTDTDSWTCWSLRTSSRAGGWSWGVEVEVGVRALIAALLLELRCWNLWLAQPAGESRWGASAASVHARRARSQLWAASARWQLHQSERHPSRVRPPPRAE